MKYFGEKSLSSALSTILHVSWYVVITGSILSAVLGVLFMFYIPLGDPVMAEIIKGHFHNLGMNYNDKDWAEFNKFPLAVKFLVLPYFGAVVVLLLKIIKKSQSLFKNFENDILFNRNNVIIISNISKLNIAFSLLTFSFTSLLASVFLFMLCEIFKNGTALQEEHEYTV
jgi:hypothetical protein